MGCRLEACELVRIRRREQIPATIQPEHVSALVRGLLEQIDASRDEAEHRVVGTGPPIAIALGALVGRQRHRWKLVDDDHAANALARAQVVRRGETGNARAADDDVGSICHEGILRTFPMNRIVPVLRSRITKMNGRSTRNSVSETTTAPVTVEAPASVPASLTSTKVFCFTNSS